GTVTGPATSFAFRFGGMEFDTATSLYHAGNSYYSPKLQRSIEAPGASGSGGGGPSSPLAVPGLPGASGSELSSQGFKAGVAADLGAGSGAVAAYLAVLAGSESGGPIGVAVGVTVIALAEAAEQLFGFNPFGGSEDINPKFYHPNHGLRGLTTFAHVLSQLTISQLDPKSNSDHDTMMGTRQSHIQDVQEIVPIPPELPGLPLSEDFFPPFSFSPRRPVTLDRCLDSAEHPALWANMCRDMPNKRLGEACWRHQLAGVQEKRNLCLG